MRSYVSTVECKKVNVVYGQNAYILINIHRLLYIDYYTSIIVRMLSCCYSCIVINTIACANLNPLNP